MKQGRNKTKRRSDIPLNIKTRAGLGLLAQAAQASRGARSRDMVMREIFESPLGEQAMKVIENRLGLVLVRTDDVRARLRPQ